MSIRPLCPELAEKARLELNEDSKKISSDLEHIKSWLAKQPHICARTDDQWLVAFLRGFKYSLETTKQKLDFYYSLRTVAPEFCKYKHDDPIFDEIFDLGVFLILPNTASPISPRIIVVRPGVFDPEKYNMIDVFSVVVLIQKILIADDDKAVICGSEYFVDLEGLSMGHLQNLNPTLLRKMVVQIIDAAPVQVKGTHYINCPSIFQRIMSWTKPFLNEELQNKMYLHNNLEELYQYIPKSILPKEYGGDLGTIKEITDQLKAKKQQYSSWLEEDVKYRTDESKRRGTSTTESLFGTDGSFRKIEID